MSAPGVLAGLRRADPLAPLAWLIVLLPVWWVLGLANLAWFVAAVPMTLVLVRSRRLRLPPGFGWWLLFCLWLVLSLTMVGLDPAGTTVQSASSRLLPIGFRLAEYGAATVMLLWAYNLDPVGVPAIRMVRLLGVLMAWTVAGGLLGLIAPDFQLTSPVERLLPNSVLSDNYVSALVHPAAAQIQDVAGVTAGRPSAPFPYTNSWGNSLGLLLPFGLVCALRARSAPTRVVWFLIAAVSLVPAVLSLNRGLWVALALGALLAVVALMAMGHVVPATFAIGLGTVALAVVLVSPLGRTAETRGTGEQPSNDIRSFSVSRSIEIAEESPVLGYGGTRAQQGSSASIAIGKSDECPNCGNLPLGTNGQAWFVLVGQGFVGLLLYLGFHLALLRRFARSRDPVVIAGAVMTVLTIWFATVYDRSVATGCVEFLGLAVAAKALTDRRTAPTGSPARPGPRRQPSGSR